MEVFIRAEIHASEITLRDRAPWISRPRTAEGLGSANVEAGTFNPAIRLHPRLLSSRATRAGIPLLLLSR